MCAAPIVRSLWPQKASKGKFDAVMLGDRSQFGTSQTHDIYLTCTMLSTLQYFAALYSTVQYGVAVTNVLEQSPYSDTIR